VQIVENIKTSKIDEVRSLFDTPEKYLARRQYDIRLRREIVDEFTNGLTFERILDIGCGDGSISLPLLSRSKRLTLLDVSTNMLDLSRKEIPLGREQDVDLINDDFMNANLKPASFDLVISLGVLAHVDSPEAAISEIARITKPGGSIIFQFTDSFHLWSVPVIVYQQLLKMIRPEPYSLNRLSRRQVLRLCQDHRLAIATLYRYSLPPLGTSTFTSQDEMYKITRYLFGSASQNRNRWMGNDFIYRFEKI
jgi:ubiquinone/menaquinone biosynthesis C-methylase UbiE